MFYSDGSNKIRPTAGTTPSALLGLHWIRKGLTLRSRRLVRSCSTTAGPDDQVLSCRCKGRHEYAVRRYVWQPTNHVGRSKLGLAGYTYPPLSSCWVLEHEQAGRIHGTSPWTNQGPPVPGPEAH